MMMEEKVTEDTGARVNEDEKGRGYSRGGDWSVEGG